MSFSKDKRGKTPAAKERTEYIKKDFSIPIICVENSEYDQFKNCPHLLAMQYMPDNEHFLLMELNPDSFMKESLKKLAQ